MVGFDLRTNEDRLASSQDTHHPSPTMPSLITLPFFLASFDMPVPHMPDYLRLHFEEHEIPNGSPWSLFPSSSFDYGTLPAPPGSYNDAHPTDQTTTSCETEGAGVSLLAPERPAEVEAIQHKTVISHDRLHKYLSPVAQPVVEVIHACVAGSHGLPALPMVTTSIDARGRREVWPRKY